jgi:CheY-like chemotaxis protein
MNLLDTLETGLFAHRRRDVASVARMLGAGTILLVEDEPTLQRILGSVLGDAGYRVEAVGTAEQALERLEEGTDVDLVLTDKNLPRSTGLQLLADVRSAERHGRKPTGVVVITGYPGRDSALQALLADADGYLVKPFRSLSHAVDEVQRVLGSDLAGRRAAARSARQVVDALDDNGDVAGLRVQVLDRPAAGVALQNRGAIVVQHNADVVVAADIAALLAAPSTSGRVLLDRGATLADVIALIAAGGAAVIDDRWAAP